MKRIFFFTVLVCVINRSDAQFSLTSNFYSQNFDSLANTGTSALMPAGWHLGEAGASSDTLYRAGTGSSSTGDTYSFGNAGSTERSLGALRSGSLNSVFGFYFTNNTGHTIISINISYKGETWRVGAANRSDRLKFQYSSSAVLVTTGSWLDSNSLDYNNAPRSTTGNGTVLDSANISSSINGLSIPNGASFFIRWVDTDASGNDDGMAIDDFSMNVTVAIITPVLIKDFTGTNDKNGTLLNWTTVSENNNKGFEIQSSVNGSSFNSIGFVSSHANNGNSATALNYNFHDPIASMYYRLKQIDLNNKIAYSNILRINSNKDLSSEYSLLNVRLYPNPAHDKLNISIHSNKQEKVVFDLFNSAGIFVKQEKMLLNTGANDIQIKIAALSAGTYILRISGETEYKVCRFLVR